MSVMPIHQRMAELWMIQRKRKLTDGEALELTHCLVANVAYCWEMAYLENLSLLASMTNNVDWQHEVCLEIDRLQETGQRKKPGSKKRPDQK